jgi:hypothetical protein
MLGGRHLKILQDAQEAVAKSQSGGTEHRKNERLRSGEAPGSVSRFRQNATTAAFNGRELGRPRQYRLLARSRR